MLRKCNKVLAFLLALALVVTSFRSDFFATRVFAEGTDTVEEAGTDEATGADDDSDGSVDDDNPSIFEYLDSGESGGQNGDSGTLADQNDGAVVNGNVAQNGNEVTDGVTPVTGENGTPSGEAVTVDGVATVNADVNEVASDATTITEGGVSGVDQNSLLNANRMTLRATPNSTEGTSDTTSNSNGEASTEETDALSYDEVSGYGEDELLDLISQKKLSKPVIIELIKAGKFSPSSINMLVEGGVVTDEEAASATEAASAASAASATSLVTEGSESGKVYFDYIINGVSQQGSIEEPWGEEESYDLLPAESFLQPDELSLFDHWEVTVGENNIKKYEDRGTINYSDGIQTGETYSIIAVFKSSTTEVTEEYGLHFIIRLYESENATEYTEDSLDAQKNGADLKYPKGSDITVNEINELISSGFGYNKYDLKGIFADSDFVQAFEGYTNIESEKTVYIKYVKKAYPLYYVANFYKNDNGELAAEKQIDNVRIDGQKKLYPADSNVEVGDVSESLPDVKKLDTPYNGAEYELKGIYEDKDYTIEFKGYSNVNEQKVVYAKYVYKETSVEYPFYYVAQYYEKDDDKEVVLRQVDNVRNNGEKRLYIQGTDILVDDVNESLPSISKYNKPYEGAEYELKGVYEDQEFTKKFNGFKSITGQKIVYAKYVLKESNVQYPLYYKADFYENASDDNTVEDQKVDFVKKNGEKCYYRVGTDIPASDVNESLPKIWFNYELEGVYEDPEHTKKFEGYKKITSQKVVYAKYVMMSTVDTYFFLLNKGQQLSADPESGHQPDPEYTPSGTGDWPGFANNIDKLNASGPEQDGYKAIFNWSGLDQSVIGYEFKDGTKELIQAHLDQVYNDADHPGEFTVDDIIWYVYKNELFANVKNHIDGYVSSNIVYDSNYDTFNVLVEGESRTTPQIVRVGESVTVRDNMFTPVDKDYVFIGWNTKADGSGTWYKNSKDAGVETITLDHKVVLYAQWLNIPSKYRKLRIQVDAVGEDVDTYRTYNGGLQDAVINVHIHADEVENSGYTTASIFENIKDILTDGFTMLSNLFVLPVYAAEDVSTGTKLDAETITLPNGLTVVVDDLYVYGGHGIDVNDDGYPVYLDYSSMTITTEVNGREINVRDLFEIVVGDSGVTETTTAAATRDRAVIAHLYIRPVTVEIQAPSRTITYNGNPLSDGTPTYLQGQFVQNEAEVSIAGTITDAGSVDNVITVTPVAEKYQGEAGRELFEKNYDVIPRNGTLTVNPIYVEIYSNSWRREYNGLPLSDSTAMYTQSTFINNEAKVEIPNSITEVGTIENTIYVTPLAEKYQGTAGQALFERNYKVTLRPGTLEIYSSGGDNPPTPTPTPTPTPGDDTPPATPTVPTTTPPAGQVLGATRALGAGDGAAVLGARRGRTEDSTNTFGRIVTIIVAAGIGFTMIFIKRKKNEED